MAGSFDATVQVLICNNCGAALPPAPAGGGQITCQYCHTVTMVGARDDAPIGSGAPMDEAQRIAGLWSQLGSAGLNVHGNVPALMENGSLPDRNLKAAIDLWNHTRQVQVADPASVGDDLLWLTSALSDYYAIRGDSSTSRAMWETILDVCHTPRMKQYVRCALARQASKAGDMDAAQRWLAPCDSRPPDLLSDSLYRMTYASLMTRMGQFDNVLAALGRKVDSLPLFFSVRVLACMIRANAVEKTGDVNGAADQIRALIQADPSLAQVIPMMIKASSHLDLCPQSGPMALGH